MPLHIDLQDGFKDDEVIVRLDGREILHKSGVTTDIRISRADGIEATSTKADAQIEIELPKKNLRGTQTIKTGETPHIGISVTDGKPQFRVSAQPHRYM